jgi:hypothetical protein
MLKQLQSKELIVAFPDLSPVSKLHVLQPRSVEIDLRFQIWALYGACRLIESFSGSPHTKKTLIFNLGRFENG